MGRDEAIVLICLVAYSYASMRAWCICCLRYEPWDVAAVRFRRLTTVLRKFPLCAEVRDNDRGVCFVLWRSMQHRGVGQVYLHVAGFSAVGDLYECMCLALWVSAAGSAGRTTYFRPSRCALVALYLACGQTPGRENGTSGQNATTRNDGVVKRHDHLPPPPTPIYTSPSRPSRGTEVRQQVYVIP